jgi:predicted enzyme related to lactoylglutathione lyase
MVVHTIVHFEIPADDADRLAGFYGTVFGWKFEKVPMPEMDYWLIRTGPRGKSVGGGMFRRSGPDDRPRNFILVTKIDEAIRSFTEAGGTEVVGKAEVPGMGWSFIGADPEGNHIALWEPAMPARSPTRRRTPRRRARARK